MKRTGGTCREGWLGEIVEAVEIGPDTDDSDSESCKDTGKIMPITKRQFKCINDFGLIALKHFDIKLIYKCTYTLSYLYLQTSEFNMMKPWERTVLISIVISCYCSARNSRNRPRRQNLPILRRSCRRNPATYLLPAVLHRHRRRRENITSTKSTDNSEEAQNSQVLQQARQCA